MTVLEFTSPDGFDKEHRHQFEAKAPSWVHVVASGSAPLSLTIGTSDEFWEEYDVHLVVGPWWRDVQVVVPFVTMNGFHQNDWDEVDQAGWVIRDLSWDTVGGNQAPHLDEERIRLKFVVSVKGEGSFVMRIGYYFTAAGRRLGVEGLDSPSW